MPTIIEDLVRELAYAKGHWARIARDYDVPYSTLAKVAQGKRTNLNLRTLTRIQSAMERYRADALPNSPRNAGNARAGKHGRKSDRQTEQQDQGD